MKKLIPFLLMLLFFAANTFAQQSTNPFKEVIQKSNIYPDQLKSDFPQLYALLTKSNYTLADVNKWIASSTKEWYMFNRIPAINNLHTDWAAIGVKAPVTSATEK